jgi:hypothetical protein
MVLIWPWTSPTMQKGSSVLPAHVPSLKWICTSGSLDPETILLWL